MSKIISAIITLVALAGPAAAQEAIGAYWTHEAQRGHVEAVGAPLRLSGAVETMIGQAASQTIGAGWTAAMVRIAHIESGLRCSPGGNGGGLYQFIRGTRRRLKLRRPLDCVANIRAAMRYAAACIRAGARTGAQLGACWNSGSPFTARRRLERAYRVARL